MLMKFLLRIFSMLLLLTVGSFVLNAMDGPPVVDHSILPTITVDDNYIAPQTTTLDVVNTTVLATYTVVAENVFNPVDYVKTPEVVLKFSTLRANATTDNYRLKYNFTLTVIGQVPDIPKYIINYVPERGPTFLQRYA